CVCLLRDSCSTASSTTETSPLSLHDALPISAKNRKFSAARRAWPRAWVIGSPESKLSSSASRASWDSTRSATRCRTRERSRGSRSEEHTSELQSRENLVCRLLLEKKKKTNKQ